MKAIRAALALAASGRGQVVALRGEAGIGKTALLGWAREDGRREAAREAAAGSDAGGGASAPRLLSVCGAETETHLPYAALLELVEPLLPLREALPEPQKAALEGALALAAPAAGDRFTVCVAVLGLLRLAAREQPLLVLVDDAHWLDAATAECVAFAARRLEDLPIVMLVAIRDGEQVAAGLGELPALLLEPLAGDDAAAVVVEAACDVATSVRDAVVAAAAGNPLALVEIASSLAPAERSGSVPLPDPLPAGGRLATVFDRRLRALAASTREALLLAAASDSLLLASLVPACEAAGVDARAAFEDAEAAGIVAISDGRLRFLHPLMRSAAWHGASAPQRRAAHRALASVSEGYRRAWHLAESVTGPDEAAAAALSEAATQAAARRGYAEASLAWQRAAALSEDREQKARRLLRACNTSVAAGQMTSALALLDEAIAIGSSVSFSPRTMHTRCLLLLGTGEVGAAFDFLRTLADAAEGSSDAAMAAMATADAGMAALLVGDLRALLELGRKATALLGSGGDALVRAQVGACLAAGLIFRGETSEGRLVLEGVEKAVLDVHDQELALRTHSMITHLRTALEDYETAHLHASRLLASLEQISAHAAKAAPLGHAADAAHRYGQWDAAEALAREAILVAEETANGDALPRALIVRARLAAARGDEALARASIAKAAALVEGKGNLTIQAYVLAATGLLELSLGRAEEAVAALEQVAPLAVERVGLLHPSILPWWPDLAEALAMLGRTGEAARAGARLEEEARINGGAVGLALAARTAGLVAAEDFERHFEHALELHTVRPMPFEQARTLLLYGSRLHRAKRRAEARDRLRAAEAIFDSLGARPWRERAAAELVAAGAKRRAPREQCRDSLTEQELRVAATLARGVTIREAAGQLFLSPKTVDSHLRQVYAKLQIRSRAELALVAAERGWLA